MKKSQALILLSGGNIKKAADILGVSRTTIYNWPDELEQDQHDRVNGALLRLEREREALIKEFNS